MTKKTYKADAFFAGVGGIELGFNETGRVKTVYANEFDKNAGITYQLNNPDVNFDDRDIHKVKADELPNSDIMMGGFPCFTKDALVQTKWDLLSINKIKVGDLVLTREGDFKPVTQVMQKRTHELYELVIAGRPTIHVTGNHPILVRHKMIQDNGHYEYSEPEWTPVKDLQNTDLALLNPYQEGKAHRLDENQIIPLGLVENLASTPISTLVFALPVVFRKTFINKAFADKKENPIVTTNLAYAVSLASLIELTYHEDVAIETVKNHDFNCYRIIWYKGKPSAHIIDDEIWKPITSIKHVQKDATVYNLEVEDSHTYTVDGFTFHNCQAFSQAGYQKGFEDSRGTLFFEMLRMIVNKRPRVAFMENVKNLVSHDKGNTFYVMIQALVKNGYYVKWKVLNAKDYGNIPQNRERIYIVAFNNKADFERFSFPDKVTCTTSLRDVIDFGAKLPDKYYYTPDRFKYYDKLRETITSQNTVYQWRRRYVRENKSGVVPTLTANMGTGGSNVPLILTDYGRIRKLTPHETFNVQGYPKDFKLPEIANTQLYKQAGNSVVVPVIHRIAKNVIKAIDGKQGDIETGDNSYIYYKVCGKNEGQSYATNDVGVELPVYTKDDYLKAIRKKKTIEFVMKNESIKKDV